MAKHQDNDRPALRRPPGTVQVARLAGAPVLVQSSWFLVAGVIAIMCAPLVESIHPGLGFGRYLVGLLFAVVLYGSVLVHEASHAFMARAFGYRVESISLNFLGGATQMDGESQTPRQEFWIAVVGPVASLGCAAAAWGASLVPEEGSLAEFLVRALALANLLVGITNLVPALPLDGGRVLKAAIWQVSGNQHRGTMVAAWSGRALAVLVLAWPCYLLVFRDHQVPTFTWVICVVMAGFLWTAASAFLAHARMRERLPRLKGRPLSRRAVLVPGELSLSQALALAETAGAGAIVVHDTEGGAITAVVSDRAVRATPAQRRDLVPVRSVARTLTRGLVLPADIAGESLLRAVTRVPAEAYVLVEPDGALAGVLATEDVDRAYQHVAR